MTDLTLPAVEIWRLYRGRADCENRIKELKYDFAADRFCLDDCWATEAALNTALLAYNLMSLFRQAVLRTSVLQSGGKEVQHTLKTLRYKLFAKAGYTTTEGRKDLLKLWIAMLPKSVDGGSLGSLQNLFLAGPFHAHVVLGVAALMENLG